MASNPSSDGQTRDGLMRADGGATLAPMAWAPRAPVATQDDSVDLASLWTTIKERWRVVLGVAVVLTAAVMVHTALSYMEFKAVGRLYLGELDAKGKGG